MFNSILLPVDGSSLSFKPVQTVIDLASLSGAAVVVLSIAEPRLYRGSDIDAIRSGTDLEAIHLEAARDNVRKVRAIAEKAGVVCEAIVSMSLDLAEEIMETAQRSGCDLIVMATRGRMGVIDTIFSESTTQTVLKTSPVPVLVFP